MVTNCSLEENVCANGVMFTHPRRLMGNCISCTRKSPIWNVFFFFQKKTCSLRCEDSQFHVSHQMSDGCHQDDEKEECIVAGT